MAYSKLVDMKTFVLKMNIYCECYGCKDMLEKLRKFQGVKLDMDEEQRKVTILITGDPNRVIKELGKHNKKFELFEQIPPINNQEKQIVLQKPVQGIYDQRVVSQQLALEVDKSIVKKTQVWCPNGHELELKSYNEQFKCDGCEEAGFGPRYRCEHCDYDLHQDCRSPELTISPEIFPGSTFVFCRQQTRERTCDACGKNIHGYSYRCNGKNLDLHPCCSNLKAKLCISGTDFVLRDKVSSSAKCKWCNQKMPRGTKTSNPGCSYVSTGNKYHFHVYCITLMVHEAWLKGDINGGTYDISTTLENMNLQLGDNSNKNGGSGGGEFWKTISMFISTIAACLMGDPTGVLVPFFLRIVLQVTPKDTPQIGLVLVRVSIYKVISQIEEKK